MINLPKKDQFLKNFFNCINWEEKYLYIIDLGKLLNNFPKKMHIQKYLISGCQSQAWIYIKIKNCKTTQLYGDSDALIVKGLMSIIFIFYQGLNYEEILSAKISPFINQLKLNQNLTQLRSQGIFSILKTIYFQINMHILNLKKLK